MARSSRNTGNKGGNKAAATSQTGMNRRGFLGLMAAGAASLTASAGAWADTNVKAAAARRGRRRKPNILFIITDDQPLRSFGFLSGKALTPHIDGLAAQGVYFPRGYTTTSVCTPSRFGCLTGEYPSRCRSKSFQRATSAERQTCVGWNTNTGPGQTNLPQVLREAGYVTGIVGKCHGMSAPPYQQVPSDSDPADPEVAGVLRQNQQQLIEAVRRSGFDYAASLNRGNLDGYGVPCRALRQHNVEWTVKGALDFIEQNKNLPFYLYLSTTLLHGPSPLKSLESDPRITEAGLLEEPLTVQPSRQSVLERAKAAGVSRWLAAATWLDDGVGVVLNKLEELGLAEDTLVFYFNDNGVEGGKGTCYEGGVRTPIIIRWKGVIEPHRCQELVQNIDFAPTILDACGVEPPGDLPLDGLSLTPLLTGQRAEWRHSLYFEIGHTRAVCTKKWKYLAFRVPPSRRRPKEERLRMQERYLDRARKAGRPDKLLKKDPDARITHLGGVPGGEDNERWQGLRTYIKNYYDADQLYDLDNDPEEQNNLANDPAYKGKLEEMKALLREHLAGLPGTFAEFKA